jgi:hypothetical protein
MRPSHASSHPHNSANACVCGLTGEWSQAASPWACVGGYFESGQDHNCSSVDFKMDVVSEVRVTGEIIIGDVM